MEENKQEIEKSVKTPITQEWIDSNFTLITRTCSNKYNPNCIMPKAEFCYKSNEDEHILLIAYKEPDEDLNLENYDRVVVGIKNYEVCTGMHKIDTVEAYNKSVENFIRQINNMLKKYRRDIKHLQDMRDWAYDIVKCYGKE